MEFSRRCSAIFIFSMLCGASVVAAGHARTADSPLHSPLAALRPISAPAQAELAQVPLQFEANHGQQPAEVRFIARGGAQTLFLTDSEAVMTVRSAQKDGLASVLRMRPAGAAASRPQGVKRTESQTNYLHGSDPKRWQRDIPNYARVRYSGVYPGVDLVYYGNQRRLEYDFVVAPGADSSQVRMSIEGARSAKLEANGDLTLVTAAAPVRHLRPEVYQTVGGSRKAVEAEYVLMATNTGAHEVGFKLGDYDRTRPLVIDPVLLAGSYLGGSGSDTGYAVALDSKGFIYLTGQTNSTNFPTAGAFQVDQPGSDGYVTKLKKNGRTIIYSTYLGGSGSELFTRLTVDALGNAYVTGGTDSANFPTVNPIQTAQGNADAFLAVLNPQGSGLVFSTYYGGSGEDIAYGVALDKNRNVYLSGFTDSPNLPLAGSIQGPQGGQDGFMVKINAAGTAFQRSTYLGGAANDLGVACAVDKKGSVYIVGVTSSANFPTAGPLMAAQGGSDAFVSKFTPAGNALVYSTYLGGSGSDTGLGIALDAKGNAYVTGETQSADFPNIRAIQGAQGSSDAFVSKLNPAGNALVYSTNLGGSAGDSGWGIGVDPSGNCFVSGTTSSTNFPTVSAFQGDRPGSDAFVLKIKKSGKALLFSTYLGGSSSEQGLGLAVHPKSIVVVTGSTSSNDFPTASPFQVATGGGGDAFVARLK